MRAVLRLVATVVWLATAGLGLSHAQQQQQSGGEVSSNEIGDAGHKFFGTVSRGLASIVEKAVSQWGLPNGYILGEEGGGASARGVRG